MAMTDLQITLASTMPPSSSYDEEQNAFKQESN